MQNNYNKEVKLEVMPAGFVVRLVAFIIDSIIIGLGALIIRVPLWIISFFVTDAFWNQAILFNFSALSILLYLLSVLYFVFLTYSTGSTLGKKVMNIRVVSVAEEDLSLWQVMYRETVGRYLSTVITFLGYLLVLIDKKKQALHDKLADTQVIYGKQIKVVTCYKEVEPTVPTFVEPNLEGSSEPVEEVVEEPTEEVVEEPTEEVVEEPTEEVIEEIKEKIEEEVSDKI